MLNIDGSITQFIQCRKIFEDDCRWKTFEEFEGDVLAYLQHFRMWNERAIIDLNQDTCSSDPDLKTIPLEQENTVLPLPQPLASMYRTDQ